MFLVLVTCISLLVSLLAVWSAHSLLDTDRFTRGVEKQFENPVVTDAIGGWVGDQLSEAVVQPDRVEALLPDVLEPAAPFLTSSLQNVIDSQAQRFVASDRGKTAVTTAVRAAHATVMRVLEGERPTTGLVIVTDDKVLLNLVPVVTAVFARVQELGLFKNIELPTLDKSQTPQEQIALLSDAIGRDLKPTFGQLTIYERDPARSETLQLAQRGLKLFRAVVWLLVAITVVLAGITVWIAPDRRRALLWLGVGAVATGLLAHLAARRVAHAVPQLITDPQARAATAAVVGSVIGRLDRTLLFLTIAVGLLTILLGYVATQGREQTLRRLQSFAGRAPDAVRIGAVVLALVVLGWFGLGLVPIVLALAIVAAGFLLVRAVANEQAAEPAS